MYLGLFLTVAVLTPVAVAAEPPLATPGSLYTTIRQDLETARTQDTVRATTARLLQEREIRDSAALRLFVTGFAAVLAYDRDTAERDLTRSFSLSPSPYVALAMTANAIEIGDADAVLAWVERGFAAAASAPDPRLTIDLQLARAQALIWLSRRDEHRSQVAEALALARRSGDRRLLALALRADGVVLGEAARREGLDRFEEASRLSDGDPRAVGYHLLLMNTFLYPHRPYAEKLPLLDRALRCAQDTHDRQLEGRVLGARGAALSVLTRYREALRDLTAADALLRQTGALRSRAAVTGNLSTLLTELGDYGRADEQARISIALYRRVRNPAGVRISLDDLGRIALLQGNPSLAVNRHEHAVALSRAIGDSRYLRTALTRLGLAYITRGSWAQAERVLHESLQLAEDGLYTGRARIRAHRPR